MSPPSRGVYAGVPAVERHAERRARLLASALELLGTVGWSGTSVRAVCAHARLTPRFFYESFDDLDALAVALYDQVSERTTTRALAAVGEAVARTPEDRHAHAQAAIGSLVSDLSEDPRLARVLFVEAVGHETLARRRQDSMRALAGLIALQGRAAFGRVPGDEALVAVTASLMAGGIAEVLVAWSDGTLDVGRDELVADCAELLVAMGETAARVARTRAQAPGTDMCPPNRAR